MRALALAIFCLADGLYGCGADDAKAASAKATAAPVPADKSEASGATNAAAADATPPPVVPPKVTVAGIEASILALTNQLRGDAKALAVDAKLAYVARSWSDAQLKAGKIGHDGFPEQREAVYEQKYGVPAPFFIGAENVATTNGTDRLSDEQVGRQFLDMWANSAGHRANMVGPYAWIGVGVSISDDGRTIMATQIYAAEY